MEGKERKELSERRKLICQNDVHSVANRYIKPIRHSEALRENKVRTSEITLPKLAPWQGVELGLSDGFTQVETDRYDYADDTAGEEG